MRINPERLVLNREMVLSQNPSVDFSVVNSHEHLESELKKLGIEIKPSFNLESPFGRDRPQIHNHSRLTQHSEPRNPT